MFAYRIEKEIKHSMELKLKRKNKRNGQKNSSDAANGRPVRNGIGGRLCLYALLLCMGTLFCVWYVKHAACDVIYSDYVRLVDAYLPDVTNPDKFLVPDVLTRIPAAFLQRIVNVEVFGFSVTFDRLCTVCGLFLCGSVLAVYAARKRIGFGIFFVMCAVLFSLIKWEILLNGSAWAHVVSFGLFFLHYYILDRVYEGENRKIYRAALCVLPFVILLFAGEYIAAYTGGMLLAYIFCMAVKRKSCGRTADSAASVNRAGSAAFPADAVYADTAGCGAAFAGAAELSKFRYLFCTVLPLCLYLVSRSFAVWEHAGATELSFFEVLSENPLFLPRFFIKTFAGAVVGQETIGSLTEKGLLSDGAVLVTGLLVIAAYLFAIALYVWKKMYEKTLFPMILLLSGGMNHVLVSAGRWIFLKESYALSSRYAGQFMIGILGILLIFGLYMRRRREERAQRTALSERQGFAGICKGILIAFCIFFLAGNCYTTYDELKKMPYREENYEETAFMLRNYRAYPAEELKKRLEWNKSEETMYHAIHILEDNQLNVFR